MEELIQTGKDIQTDIQDKIQTADTCELYQFLLDLNAGKIKPTGQIDLTWLIQEVQAELDKRFLNADTTVEIFCKDKIQSSGDPGTQGNDPVIPTTTTTKPNSIIPSTLSGLNWWKIGFLGLLAYIIIRKL